MYNYSASTKKVNINFNNQTFTLGDDIVEKVEYAIEQHASFLKVIPVEELKEQEKLNQKRRW